MHSLVTILTSRPGWSRWRPSHGYGVAFPDGIYDRHAHPGAPAAYAIDRDDMDDLASRVRQIMREWKHPDRTFADAGMHAVADALGYRVEIRTPLRLLFHEEDKKIVELTEEQAYIRSYVLHRRRAAVAGPPGAGKTLLAIGVARHVAESGKRTLLTCFNKRLAEHLIASTEGQANLHVAHFHGLAMELAREAGLEVAQPAGDDDRAWFEETLPGLLEEAARRLGPRYDAIVVDESQDFKAWWWPALLATHKDPDDGTLYLFGDDSQNLYGGGDLPVTEDDILPPLPSNLRNTSSIHGFVSVFFDAEGPGAGNAKGPRGLPVEILDYDDEDELVRLVDVVITNLLEEEHLIPDDLVVLTPGGAAKSRLWARRELGRNRLSDHPEEGAILWSTVHSFKGLERPVVILAEIEARGLDEIAPYLRVGGTRAQHQLIVVAEHEAARAIRKRASIRQRSTR
jgi:superfamily I DNA and RNA helicase